MRDKEKSAAHAKRKRYLANRRARNRMTLVARPWRKAIRGTTLSRIKAVRPTK